MANWFRNHEWTAGRKTWRRHREGFVPLVGQPDSPATFSYWTYFVLAKSTRDEAQSLISHEKESPVLYTSYFIRSIQQINIIVQRSALIEIPFLVDFHIEHLGYVCARRITRCGSFAFKNIVWYLTLIRYKVSKLYLSLGIIHCHLNSSKWIFIKKKKLSLLSGFCMA